jgi:hypothetical protein
MHIASARESTVFGQELGVQDRAPLYRCCRGEIIAGRLRRAQLCGRSAQIPALFDARQQLYNDLLNLPIKPMTQARELLRSLAERPE